MKRTARVLMTVLMLAILDGGNVKPGLAQTTNGCLSLEISGASGRSVCENGWFATWTWTAPATGLVTFDTRGSDFDTLLTVFELDGTFQGEMRFSAQQGQEYGIFARWANDSIDPGTIVLNWRSSSSDGGSRASNDDFGSSVAISGASGRSTGGNVGAGKESGEPGHADDNGGASVWWTWAAPATGPATFDTRGSDFDTLLAVYTGDSLDSLDKVVSNDDAGEGERQSAVRFTAQQGQTYHVAVDGYGGVTGTIVLNWQASSDGDDVPPDVPPIEADSPLREMVVENLDPGKPGYVLAGPNASLQYWKNADGAVSQTLYRSADETVSVRTFYDETTGLPRRITDEISRNWLLIQPNGADSVDFWFYDHDGTYQNGFAVFEDADRYYFGEIAGLPIHAGKEITGDLLPTTASWTGRFTLEVDTGDLKTSKPVAAEIADLMDDLASDGALLSGLSLGGMILLGLADDSAGDAVAPADMAAFDALADDKVVVFTDTDSDDVASVEFLSAGRFVRTDQNESRPGDFSYVKTGPDTGTITLTFDPDNDPDEYEHVFEVTFTSGTMGTYASTYTERGKESAAASDHFKIADMVVTEGIATAGAAAFVTSLFVSDVAAGNRYKCTRLDNAASRDVCGMAADFLAHEGERGPTGLVRDGVDWARDKPGDLRDRIDRGKRALGNVAGELSPDDAIQERQDAETLALETPPPVGSRVSGEATGPDGTVAQVEGDITPDGDFAVAGDDDEDLSVVINGSVGDDATADSGEVTPTVAGTGTSPAGGDGGNVVVAADTTGNTAAFEWGRERGRVRSVRSAAVLHGKAPVVVRKIRFVRIPNDGRSVTIDLSEYFSDPNGDPMRFTAASDSEERLDVRVSGSRLSIRPTTPGDGHTTRIRVTATDPGGLTAEMSFWFNAFTPKAVLWTLHWASDSCSEYVILDPDAYERHYHRHVRSDGLTDSYDGSGSYTINVGSYGIYLLPIDTRSGEPKCSDSSSFYSECRAFRYWSDGLNCPDRFVSGGGCHHTFDWGISSNYLSYFSTHKEDCLSFGRRWSTQRPAPKSTDKHKPWTGLVVWLKGWIREQINDYDVPGQRKEGTPRSGHCQCATAPRG